MLTRQQFLLTLLAEECVEMAQRATKAIRFGLYETQATKDGKSFESNADRLGQEIIDFGTVIQMLEDAGVDLLPVTLKDIEERSAEKRKKIEKYLAYSWHDCGTVEPQPLNTTEFYHGTMARMCGQPQCAICAERQS